MNMTCVDMLQISFWFQIQRNHTNGCNATHKETGKNIPSEQSTKPMWIYWHNPVPRHNRFCNDKEYQKSRWHFEVLFVETVVFCFILSQTIFSGKISVQIPSNQEYCRSNNPKRKIQVSRFIGNNFIFGNNIRIQPNK